MDLGTFITLLYGIREHIHGATRISYFPLSVGFCVRVFYSLQRPLGIFFEQRKSIYSSGYS